MSIYNISDSPHVAENYAFWNDGFSESEIYKIRELGEKRMAENAMAMVGGGQVIEEIRRSKISWLVCDNETCWLYDRLAYIARQLNGQYFQFDLSGFVEDLQYTIYDESYKGHYDYHIDAGFHSGRSPRKLSMVVQLSSPDEYEGGDLEFLLGKNPDIATKKLGMLYAFPSYVLHRVTPVTKGTRRTLVVWLAGPRFR